MQEPLGGLMTAALASDDTLVVDLNSHQLSFWVKTVCHFLYATHADLEVCS